MSPDPVQIVTTFAVGAGGALSMLKLLKMLERRPAAQERKRIAALFPNGEKAEIIGAIDELKQAARDQHITALTLRSQMERLARELGISL